MKAERGKKGARDAKSLAPCALHAASGSLSPSKLLSRAREVFDIEIEGLRRTRASLGPSFVDAIRLFLETAASGGLVVVTGVGKNLHAAEKMSAIFASTGTRSIVLNPVQAMHGDLGMVSARDVLLALSFSGESEEVLRLVPAIRRHGLKVVSMTGRADSSLAAASDIHIEIPCGREACPFGMAPTNSVTATLAMGDAIAMVLLDAHKFSVRDYAANHPAGAIGRALLLTVGDVMRTGGRFAAVAPSATVMDALMAMTKAQGGSAVVVDGRGRLLGIFTDGDFRRLMSGVTGKSNGAGKTGTSGKAGVSEILSASISRYMTRSPSFVRADMPAADLLKVFEAKRIDDLPVCDAKGRVVGLVDIQDLPRVKVM